MDTYIGEKRIYNYNITTSTNNSTAFIKQTTNKTLICNNINSPCGYWENEKEFITIPRQNHHSSYNKTFSTSNKPMIMFYGDSLQFRFHDQFLSRKICKELYVCNRTYLWVYPNPPSKRIYDNKNFNKTIILESIRSVLLHPEMKKNSSVLLINFGLHLMMDVSFEEAKEVLQDFIKLTKNLKQILGDNLARIVWKTTTPPFERERYQYNEDHRRFLAKHVRYYYTATKVLKVLAPFKKYAYTNTRNAHCKECLHQFSVYYK